MTNKPCIPDILPLDNLNWKSLLPLTGKAHDALARYDGMLQTLPDPHVMLSPVVTNEAVLSSRIEGTQATLDDMLGHDAGMETTGSKRSDIEEISNYRTAMLIAEDALKHGDISLSLIKEIHQRLMQGVRGQNKIPGNFRNEQNWIGRAGSPLEEARFIPPSPMLLSNYLENLERYINSDEDSILKTLIAHAQFEIIHPFKDGNGRIGRMLIPLILYKDKVISSPNFYMSEYLEARRDVYYDKLLSVTEQQNWQEWLLFSLEAIKAQAEKNLSRVKSIRDLYQDMMKEFPNVTRSQYAAAAVDAFFTRPVINGTDFSVRGQFNSKTAANNFLRKLEEVGLITKRRESSGQMAAIYAFDPLLNLLKV